MKKIIGFYTYYQVFQEHRGSDQLIIAEKIQQLIKRLENEINFSVRDKNYKFKIFFDLVRKEQLTLDHFKSFLAKHPEITIICQVPNYFPKTQLPPELKQLICFDSFRILPEETQSNSFKTPLSSGPKQELVAVKSILKNYNLAYLILSEDSIGASEELTATINSITATRESENFDVKCVSEWKADNFRDLRLFFSNLKPNDVVFFDKDSFVNSNQTVQDKSKNRSEMLKIYSDSDSYGYVCAFRLDSRTLSNLFGDSKEELPKILNFVGEDFYKKLELQEKILLLEDKNLTSDIEQYLAWYYQIVLDKVQLVASVCQEKISSFVSKAEFVNELQSALVKIDGKNDVFVGTGEVISFVENTKITAGNVLTSYHRNKNGEIDQRLFPKQYLMKVQGSEEVHVSYPNFDFTRISNISIETGLFYCDFYLELTSPFQEGIDILRFNNLHADNIVVKQIIEEKINSEYWYHRYHINGTFQFFPSCENYPFDKQVVFISYSLVEEKYGILQPMKLNQVNKNFNSDGWTKLDFRSGIIRKKYKYTPVFKESYFVINEDNRLGMILSRPSSFAIIKVIIPLVFLLSLVVYSFYLSLDQIDTSIALLTTSFLSAIALYFSTEKPNPLVITTIDLIFMFFYLFVGISTIVIFVLSIFPNYYEFGLKIYRWFSLGLFLFEIFLILKRMSSRKFAPKIVFDDKQ